MNHLNDVQLLLDLIMRNNNWDIYKKVFRKEELEDLLSKQNIKVNIL